MNTRRERSFYYDHEAIEPRVGPSDAHLQLAEALLHRSIRMTTRTPTSLTAFLAVVVLHLGMAAVAFAQGGGVGGGVGAVPEPTVLTLVAMGVAGYGIARRKRH